MKAIMKLFVAAFIMLMSFPFDANAQLRFSEHGEEHGLKIEQRWRRSKLFQKDSDAMLVLKITNTNDYAVNINIAVGFYNDGILTFISEEQNVCFETGQTKKGGPANLRFVAEEITLADTKAEGFSWDFAKIEVAKVEGCE